MGTNVITFQGNGIVKTTLVTKHLSSQTKHPKVFMCYEFQNGITNEEEDFVFPIESSLFFNLPINLPIV